MALFNRDEWVSLLGNTPLPGANNSFVEQVKEFLDAHPSEEYPTTALIDAIFPVQDWDRHSTTIMKVRDRLFKLIFNEMPKFYGYYTRGEPEPTKFKKLCRRFIWHAYRDLEAYEIECPHCHTRFVPPGGTND